MTLTFIIPGSFDTTNTNTFDTHSINTNSIGLGPTFNYVVTSLSSNNFKRQKKREYQEDINVLILKISMTEHVSPALFFLVGLCLRRIDTWDLNPPHTKYSHRPPFHTTFEGQPSHSNHLDTTSEYVLTNILSDIKKQKQR